MITVQNYFPGQKATIFLEVLDSSGRRSDGYDGYIPVVMQIVLPNFTLVPGYPADMKKLDPGLYYFQYTIPTGAVSIGSYLIDVLYKHPDLNSYFTALYQIIVTAPYGIYTTTTQ